MKTQVCKWGNSLAVRLAVPFAKELGLEEGSELDLQVIEGTLVLRPSRVVGSRPKLKDLITQITPENRHEATEWGLAVGREEW